MKKNLPPPKDRAPLILKALKKTYPHARCELVFKTPLELLVATILSAQCTDARVNKVTPALFKKYKTAAACAKAQGSELETMIKSTGFYRNKAKSIQNCCAQLVKDHNGEVPEEMEELTKLAGVGRKTANLVRAYVFGKPGIICDTHVLRVSERLGLTGTRDPEKVEADLAALLPQKNWARFSTLIMWHGRRMCTARNPSCRSCPVLDFCPLGLSNA